MAVCALISAPSTVRSPSTRSNRFFDFHQPLGRGTKHELFTSIEWPERTVTETGRHRQQYRQLTDRGLQELQRPVCRCLCQLASRPGYPGLGGAAELQ